MVGLVMPDAVLCGTCGATCFARLDALADQRLRPVPSSASTRESQRQRDCSTTGLKTTDRKRKRVTRHRMLVCACIINVAWILVATDGTRHMLVSQTPNITKRSL